MKRTYEFNISVTTDEEDEQDGRDRARELITPKYPLSESKEEVREGLLIWCYPDGDEEGFDPERMQSPEPL